LIFVFFYILDWSRSLFFLLKIQYSSPLLQFYFKYSIDFYVFLFFFSLWLFSLGSLFFYVISFYFIALKWKVLVKPFVGWRLFLKIRL
jgi:hypothetical protein